MENEGSLSNRVMNEQAAGRRPRGTSRKDGEMPFGDVLLLFHYLVQHADYVCIVPIAMGNGLLYSDYRMYKHT